MKLLIVDDERLIGSYIAQCVEQADCGVEVIGTVTSAARALQLIEGQTIDLIFADITMPKMNGLELLKIVKRTHPEIMVIMLTCHHDFDFVRTAMQYDADRYVLKSEIDPELMREILTEAQHVRHHRKVEQIDQQVRRQDCLKRIVTGEWAFVTEALLQKHSVRLRSDDFVAVCVIHTSKNIQCVTEHMASCCENMVPYEYDAQTMVLVMNLMTDQSKMRIQTCMQELSDCIEGHLGRSRICHDLNQLAAVIHESVSDMNEAYYADTVTDPAMYSRNQIMLKLCQTADLHARENQLKTYSADLAAILQAAADQHPAFLLLRDQFRQLILLANQQFFPIMPLDVECVHRSVNFEDLRAVISSMIHRMMQLAVPYSKNIQVSVEYIESHFKDDLLLSDVSKQACVNSAYLSRQFKKEVGMTFSEYLTEVRMKRAKTLLETTDLRISEIACEVGVGNVSYFSTLFRKQYHCSPKDIRHRSSSEIVQIDDGISK